MKGMRFKKAFFFIMALVIGSFAAAGILTSLETHTSEAEFVVTYMEISPDEAEVGEAVTVSAIVRNTGGETDTCTATLTLNGDYVDSQDVTLGRQETKTVTFRTFHVTVPGTYEVAVDDTVDGTLDGMSRTLVVTGAEEPTPEATPQE